MPLPTGCPPALPVPLLLAIAIAIALSWPPAAAACVVAERSAEAAIADADAIFRGRVTGHDTTGPRIGVPRFAVTVQRVYKGDVPRDIWVHVGPCDLAPPPIRTEWLLLADRVEGRWYVRLGAHSQRVDVPPPPHQPGAPGRAVESAGSSIVDRLASRRPIVHGIHIVKAQPVREQILGASGDGPGRALVELPTGVFSIDLTTGERTRRYVSPADADEHIDLADRSVLVTGGTGPTRIQTAAGKALRPATRGAGMTRADSSMLMEPWMIRVDFEARVAALFDTRAARRGRAPVTTVRLRLPLETVEAARALGAQRLRVYGHAGESEEANAVWTQDVDRRSGAAVSKPRLVARGDAVNEVVPAGDVDLFIGLEGTYWVDAHRIERAGDGWDDLTSAGVGSDGRIVVSSGGVLQWYDPTTRTKGAHLEHPGDLTIMWRSGDRLGGLWAEPKGPTWVIEFEVRHPRPAAPSPSE